MNIQSMRGEVANLVEALVPPAVRGDDGVALAPQPRPQMGLPAGRYPRSESNGAQHGPRIDRRSRSEMGPPGPAGRGRRRARR
jgi:hypothetical protein